MLDTFGGLTGVQQTVVYRPPELVTIAKPIVTMPGQQVGVVDSGQAVALVPLEVNVKRSSTVGVVVLILAALAVYYL